MRLLLTRYGMAQVDTLYKGKPIEREANEGSEGQIGIHFCFLRLPALACLDERRLLTAAGGVSKPRLIAMVQCSRSM
jgi:hypothetical protein